MKIKHNTKIIKAVVWCILLAAVLFLHLKFAPQSSEVIWFVIFAASYITAASIIDVIFGKKQ